MHKRTDKILGKAAIWTNLEDRVTRQRERACGGQTSQAPAHLPRFLRCALPQVTYPGEQVSLRQLSHDRDWAKQHFVGFISLNCQDSKEEYYYLYPKDEESRTQ